MALLLTVGELRSWNAPEVPGLGVAMPDTALPRLRALANKDECLVSYDFGSRLILAVGGFWQSVDFGSRLDVNSPIPREPTAKSEGNRPLGRRCDHWPSQMAAVPQALKPEVWEALKRIALTTQERLEFPVLIQANQCESIGTCAENPELK